MKFLLTFIQDHEQGLRTFTRYLFALPLFFLPWLFIFDHLGNKPILVLSQVTGHMAMAFLLITLAITPLRRWFGFACIKFKLAHGKRLSDWNFMIRWRRQFGIFSFIYSSIHLLVYIGLKQAWQWQQVVQDFKTASLHLITGILAWLLLLALSATSKQSIRRQMGSKWRPLQRSVYLIVILVLVHLALASTETMPALIIYGILTFAFLVHRILASTVKRFKREADDGLEVTR